MTQKNIRHSTILNQRDEEGKRKEREGQWKEGEEKKRDRLGGVCELTNSEKTVNFPWRTKLERSRFIGQCVGFPWCLLRTFINQ